MFKYQYNQAYLSYSDKREFQKDSTSISPGPAKYGIEKYKNRIKLLKEIELTSKYDKLD